MNKNAPKVSVVMSCYNAEKYLKLAIDSDIVIMGSTSDIYIKERLKQDKITFRYCERIFFNGIKTFLYKKLLIYI